MVFFSLFGSARFKRSEGKMVWNGNFSYVKNFFKPFSPQKKFDIQMEWKKSGVFPLVSLSDNKFCTSILTSG